VWKIGSRWDEYGAAGTSIKEFFMQYNIAIIGTNDRERVLRDVKKGHYIALADGYNIVAVGKVFEEPQRLSKYNLQKADLPAIFKVDEDNVGIRADFKQIEIPFQYERRGTFFEAFQIAEKVIKLYNELYNSFDIKPSKILKNIVDDQYVVPIYQRPYSWEKAQIERFINDIFANYWGEESLSIPETMFIGTMELSDGIYLGNNCINIIDGQQRITTLMLLLQVLRLRYTYRSEFQNIRLNTTVNNGSEQNLLDEFWALSLFDLKDNKTNRYINNAFLINNILTDKLIDNSPFYFDASSFEYYLYHDIKFVVINIKAGLSKTLKVFNTINTAGLDLAQGDIFKLRMFEYLGSNDEDLKKISFLYERIAEYNKKIGVNESNISEILKLYQVEIISTYNLTNILYGYDHVRFFE
ncbi:MAG: DUF262 domain-containing protein, partial [Mariniphaga sp.]